MAGEIQLNSITFATESDGTITVANVDSATNRQNLGLEIGVDVQSFDADTTKNDVANTFTSNQIISVTDNTNAALRVTQLGTGNALVVEDSTNPDSTPFVVDASGNVGVGTSSPTQRLQVDGGAFRITGNYASIANNQGLLIGFDSASDEARYYTVGSNGGGVGEHVFYAFDYSTGAGSERMRIDSSGAVTINNLGTGTVYSNSGVLTNTNPSDLNLKENVVEVSYGLSEVKQLRPVEFDWIADEADKHELGFIAQEVQLIIPDLVNTYERIINEETGETEIGYGLESTQFIPVLVKAIQEQQVLIESQQSQIDVLTARIEALETI
jgi:hypothetical protein